MIKSEELQDEKNRVDGYEIDLDCAVLVCPALYLGEKRPAYGTGKKFLSQNGDNQGKSGRQGDDTGAWH